jgi:hypothetical protein
LLKNNNTVKQFIFLYPIPDYINFEIKRGAYGFRSKREKEFLAKLKKASSDEEKEAVREEAIQVIQSEFKVIYKKNLNGCIDARYRQNGFNINYLIFDNSKISNVIELQKSDRIIENGLDFGIHTTKRPDGSYQYPDQGYILDKLGETNELRIAGFHMWDCVEKLAKRSYERGLDTLVDEDLTEFFIGRLKDPNFKINKYPTYKPREDPEWFESFMKARKGKPWLWQDY